MIHKGLRYFIALFLLVAISCSELRAQTPGTLDTSYYRAMGVDRVVYGGVSLSDGSVIVVGELTGVNQRLIRGIAKLNSDGSTDYGYNNNGSGTNNVVMTVKKQFGEKLIIGGYFTQYNGVATNRIMRVLPDGTKDVTFSGVVGNGYVADIIVSTDTTGDSTVVAVGSFTSAHATSVGRIARFKYNGTRDLSFTPGTGANNTINAIDRQADGKYIIVGSFTAYNGTTVNKIIRINADGTLDTSFNPGAGPNGNLEEICILPNGKILISGLYMTSYDGTTVGRLAMLNSDGSLCTTFNGGTGLNSAANKMYPDGNKIIIGGAFSSYKGISVPRLVRIDTTGTIDSTFVTGSGPSGALSTIFSSEDNSIYIGGQFDLYNNTARYNIAKINSAGALLDDFMGSSLFNNVISCATIQNDGKVIVGGAFTKYSSQAVNYLARLNLDGTLDNTFDVGTGPNTQITAIAIQPDGKIIVGGGFGTFNGTTANDIVRLNTDGTLDASFNSGSGFSCCGISKIKVLQNGKIMVSGNFGSYKGMATSKLVRILANGNVDNTFAVASVGGGNNGIIEFEIQPDGKIIIGGDFGNFSGKTGYSIARLDTNGKQDTTFRHGMGKDNNHAVRGIHVQDDGKIIVAGAQNMSFDGILRYRITRLFPDGSVDVSYNASNTAANEGGAGPQIYDLMPYGSGVLAAGAINNSIKYINSSGDYVSDYFSIPATSYYGETLSSIVKNNFTGHIIGYGSYSKLGSHFVARLAAFQNYIDELKISSTICTNTTQTIYFSKNATFNPANVFTVQLSNSSGSFASPVEIGRDTTGGWGLDSLQMIIPTGTTPGSGYRVRITSTNPIYTSILSDAFTIGASPSQKTVLQAATAVYPSLGTQVKVVASQTGVHYSLISDTTVVDTGNGTGDTLRLHTGGIYGPKNYVVNAQLGGCSLVLDTVFVDTLGVRQLEWEWVGFTKNPDNSITAQPEPGDDKMEGKSYNLVKRDKDGIVTFSFTSDHDYSGFFAFGDNNNYSDIGYGFLLAQDTVSGPDSLGLYLMLEKDAFIPLRGLTGGPLTVTMHKHGNVGDIYINGLLQDTTITWPDTLDFNIQLAAFAPGSIKSVTTSYAEMLRWSSLQANHADCGGSGSTSAGVLGGTPPYHFHWSNGDTTSTPDSLLVGVHHVTVTDFAGDTLIDSVDIVYNAMIDSAHNVGTDSLGRMVSSGFTEFFSSYCWYVNTLPIGADGWMRYDIPEGAIFQGHAGFTSNVLFDERHSGFGIMVFGNGIYVTGDDIDGMGYLGSYELGQKLSLKMRFEGDYLYCGKVEEWGTMEIPFYLPRTTTFRPGVVQLAEGSVYPNGVTTFNCDQMFANIIATPSTSATTQGQVRIYVKGGKVPYTYLWSNAATTPTINVLPGSYTVTVSDANGTSITAQAFVGTYVEWLASNNVEETPGHEIVATANTPEGYGIQHNYIFCAQALAPGQDGCFSFDFARAGDFAGTIGLATDYLMAHGSQGFGLVIVQDRMSFGIDPEIYYVDEEGQMQYFGSFTEQMPMNIKIKKTGTFVEIVKNDVGGISREFTAPLTFRPIISPIFAGDKITRVTANVGVPLQSVATAQPSSCGGNTIGSISLDVRGGQPPYHFNWSNGDTTSTPDSLDVGLYTVQIWDAQLDTIIDSIYIGYGMDWDTTFNVGDTLGMLISTGNNSTESFDSYAYALNSLAPEEDGWVEFVIPQNTVYNGAMAMNANKHYDETTEGIGINIVNGYIIVRGSMITGNTIMAPYKPAAGYRFRIEFNGNNIDVTYKDLLGLAPGRKISVNYTRTQAWSPTVIFGLNGAKISSISSSFGCGGMHADAIISPSAKDGNTGSIYSQVKGGYPPYIYAWSNSSSSANLVNVPIGSYSLTVQDQSGATQVVNTFLGRYTDWDVLSGMAELGNSVVYEGDTVDFDSTIVSFAIARNAIRPGANGTVSFDFEKAGDFTGAVGLSESPELFRSQDGALAVVGLINGDLYILDENGSPAFFGKLRENLPVNIQIYKTPSEFAVTKNNLSTMFISRATTGYLSPVVIPALPGDKVQRVTCDFGRKLSVKPIVTHLTCGNINSGSITLELNGGIAPYICNWISGDTTITRDSLAVGTYPVTIIDSIGDSLAIIVNVGYELEWDTTDGFDEDSVALTSSIPAAHATATGIIDQSTTGKLIYKIKPNSFFRGYVGVSDEFNYNSSAKNFEIYINGISVLYTQDRINYTPITHYNPSLGLNIEIEFSSNTLFTRIADYDKKLAEQTFSIQCIRETCMMPIVRSTASGSTIGNPITTFSCGHLYDTCTVPLPVGSISSIQDTVCWGDSTILFVSAEAGYTYQWYKYPVVPANYLGTGDSVKVRIDSTTQFCVIVLYPCSTSASCIKYINSIPTDKKIYLKHGVHEEVDILVNHTYNNYKGSIQVTGGTNDYSVTWGDVANSLDSILGDSYDSIKSFLMLLNPSLTFNSLSGNTFIRNDLQAGEYSVTVKDAECMFTKKIQVGYLRDYLQSGENSYLEKYKEPNGGISDIDKKITTITKLGESDWGSSLVAVDTFFVDSSKADICFTVPTDTIIDTLYVGFAEINESGAIGDPSTGFNSSKAFFYIAGNSCYTLFGYNTPIYIGENISGNKYRVNKNGRLCSLFINERLVGSYIMDSYITTVGCANIYNDGGSINIKSILY